MKHHDMKARIEKGYAGLLGKVIGVRLGAPVESWDAARIAETYGEPDGYLRDYRNFASDDDLNGPLFFFRALLDYGQDFSAEQMGKTVLNYVPHGHSFFWWGGYGISTEHTAYENLRAGIPAPISGSIAQNGAVCAEQIGGQIFSDCWGLVCPGNPDRAADYAQIAASVTHDGEGRYGGRFVAACIAAAYEAQTVREVIDAGLARIPSDCLYAKVARDIMAFYEAHPDDWHLCLRYIQDNWGYDRYPGLVHIIPNAAVMILALCYGGGEFGKTLRICNFCGWDTDCNVGNLGTIMGVLLGLEGIEALWKEPLCDFLAASSSIGWLNIIDLANASLLLSRLASEIEGSALPAPYADYVDEMRPVCHFELPGTVHGFRVEGVFSGRPENSADCAHEGSRSLKLGGRGAGPVRLLQRTYYVPGDFDDSRYDPSFSPTAYPGAQVRAYARSGGGALTVRLVAWGRDGEELCAGVPVTLGEGWRELTLSTAKAPKDSTIFAIGIEVDCGAGAEIALYLDDFRITSDADYVIDFAKEREEKWNRYHREISQLTRVTGIWQMLDGGVCASGTRLCRAYTGHYYWQDYTVTSRVVPLRGEAFRLLGRVQGTERAYAATLRDGALYLEKQDGEFTPLGHAPLRYAPGEAVELTLVFEGSRITAQAGGVTVSVVDEAAYAYGCIGWGVESGRIKVERASVKTA